MQFYFCRKKINKMATSLSPFVYWGQSNATISLKVDLRHVENVEVSLTEENLDFNAQGLGVKGVNQYSFHLDFYLPVDPKKSRYRKTDLAVEFQIEKSVAETWPRLTKQKLKLPWLKIDFDKFPVDDSEENSDEDDDTKNVEVSLTEENLDFNAQGLGVKGVNQYSFHLDFYLPVDPKKSRYRKTDLAVEFQIEKSVAETWPRLTKQKLKLPWLKIDFDKFPVDDSEENSDEDDDTKVLQKSNEELLNKLTADLSSNDQSDLPSPSQTYLFTYNLFQFVGYTYIFISLIYHSFKNDENAKQAAFEDVGTQMMVCQAVSFLEIIHVFFKLVHSQILTTVLQVSGRNFILFFLILQEPRLQISPLCWYLFLTWSFIEIIRYPFYILQLLNLKLKFLIWLRYSVWIILYPLGIKTCSEAAIVFQSITYFSETGYFSIALPNSANLAFYFPFFLMVYLVAMCFGSTNNLKYMYIQRKKQLSHNFKGNGSNAKHKTS
ncbi:Very-long-chain (3R)-3-hydroxyacyl-CoA dehydratase [Bulinus truncatus]|nr:Very-long-chain (3R)-3-hydroxyacyl-CoA dehydratase [Bulinus truncatus]